MQCQGLNGRKGYVILVQNLTLVPIQGRNGNFSGGGGSHLSRFFPVVILAFSWQEFPFWQTPEKFQWFPKSEKKKKKKKKKHCSFSFFFLLSLFKFFLIFLLSLSIFPLFSSTFTIFLPFFIASFFPITCQKFPGGKSLGALCPLPLRLLCHCSSTTTLGQRLSQPLFHALTLV